MGSITKRIQGENVYYVYQETYRAKIDPNDSGKKPGTGKSKVCTKAIYLGSAEKILQSVKKHRKPTAVKTRHFGLVAAALQTASQLGLQQLLEKHVQGKRGTVPRWVYLFVTIINRLDHATSKNQMGKWLQKTILPELLHFDYKKLTSKNFWYATDDVIPEKELRERRKKQKTAHDLFAGLKEDVFTRIEQGLFTNIDQLMGLGADTIFYDTTNFFTYIEETTPSELAQTCHSKDSKHHLRHVGLIMAVEKSYGIPLISRIYRANRHDSKVFSMMLTELILDLKKLCGEESDLVIVLDKGNNSEENFGAMSGKISWVGSLVPSHHEDLIDLELSQYHGKWRGLLYYRCKKTVMGIECVVVLVYNSATARKQEHSLNNGIEKLKKKIMEKWESYKKTPKDVPQGIKTMLKKSGYGACLKVAVKNGKLHFDEDENEKAKRRKRFGKNVIFSDMLDADAGYLIDTYGQKNTVEDDFGLLKDPTLIRFRPIRHWTDTKIRAYAFCCVVSMTLMRVMQWKAEQAGYKMSPKVLKEELSDLQEVVMVYSETEAERKITDRSSVQEKLWKIFELGEIEKKLLLH